MAALHRFRWSALQCVWDGLGGGDVGGRWAVNLIWPITIGIDPDEPIPATHVVRPSVFFLPWLRACVVAFSGPLYI